MKTVIALSFAFIACVFVRSCAARDLLVGQVFQSKLMYQERKEYWGIPFKKRVKEFFYSDPAQQPIKAIVARDVLGPNSEATASITSGGVGYTYVNLRLKSERGSGLNYHIEIYV